MIEQLPLLRADASRSARTIERCHERLAARRRKIEARSRAAAARALGAERLFVVGCCVVYLMAMAADIIGIAAQR